MASSIFDIEIRLDINKEFNKMVNILHKQRNTTLSYRRIYATFIEALNSYAFKKWPYRGTSLNCEEYLENIGLDSSCFSGVAIIGEKKFLYYLEFIYNIFNFAYKNKYIEIDDEDVNAIILNFDIITEKMNYKFVEDGEKYLLVKRNSNIDSILSIVDEDIASLLLEYNDFKNKDNKQRKSEILKSIDRYIENNQSEYSKIDKDTYKSIGYIMNKFGINHKIDDKYKDLAKKELIEWYDKCFILCIHIIRELKVKQINQERKNLENK